jgi:hypothetical protein
MQTEACNPVQGREKSRWFIFYTKRAKIHTSYFDSGNRPQISEWLYLRVPFLPAGEK